MQTFLPYEDFKQSAKVLDYRRLGKQRLEAYQILQILLKRKSGWKNHPAVLMWQNYENALKLYFNICVQEWVARGYKNNYKLFKIKSYTLPDWIGSNIHSSHRANLLRKNYEFYSKYGWKENPNMPYYWPITILKTR